MKTVFLLLALVLCARSEDANKKVETQNKDKRQTEEGAPHLVYRTARKQEQVAPVEENQEDDKGLRDPHEYRPGQVFSVNAQELLELQPERKAPLSNNQQLQQLYVNPQQEQRQNIQQFYYLEPQLSRQVAFQPSHAVIARPSYSSNGGEASVGAALAVSDTGANSAESLDQELLALLGHQLRQDDGRPQTFTQLQQTPQPHLTTQNSIPQYQQVDIPYVPKPSKKPTKLRPKVQMTPTPTSAAPQQYLIETTNVQQQQHHQQQQQQQQFRPITQNQRVPQTLRYVPIQTAPSALQQTLYERPESQGLKIVPAPKLQQLNPQYNYRIQYQQEASPKQFRIIETPRPQPIRQEQPRLLTSNERPVTYLKRFPEPEKLRAVADQNVQEGLSSVQRPTQIPEQYYLRPVYRSNEQRSRYELQGMALRPTEQSRSIETVKPLSAIYVSKNITPKKVLRPLIRLDQSSKVEQPQREQAYRIEQQQHSGTEQANVEQQQAQSLEEQRAHLPPPRNNKAYTPEEFAALLAAGYSVTPVPVGQTNHQVAQSRSASEAITVQQRRPMYSRRHHYLPLRGDDAP
ncbi:alpha-protein kinase 1-like isoform X1 [Vanessa atalanta]|uniref:alpha-protein kinase 1-like isoform X1 n=1 Tax=Vanessa atalanta TaxID=42275 RepID=UPI001FCD5662|nr:alpha-protein kinase 1-like isoform X1 [Vanessa atalanta]